MVLVKQKKIYTWFIKKEGDKMNAIEVKNLNKEFKTRVKEISLFIIICEYPSDDPIQ